MVDEENPFIFGYVHERAEKAMKTLALWCITFSKCSTYAQMIMWIYFKTKYSDLFMILFKVRINFFFAVLKQLKNIFIYVFTVLTSSLTMIE